MSLTRRSFNRIDTYRRNDDLCNCGYYFNDCIFHTHLHVCQLFIPKKCGKENSKIENQGYSKEELLRRIEQKGGTSIASVLVVIAIFILLAVVILSYLY